MSAEPVEQWEARSPRELRALVGQMAPQLADASAYEILEWAAQEFGEGLAVASSMADAVLPHLAARALPGVDVVFLDTGYHFEETLHTRDEVARQLQVRMLNIEPVRSVPQQDAEFGTDLFGRDPSACCRMRKIEPLAAALQGYEAWATGLRRSDSAARASTATVAWDERHAMVKVNPIVAWTDEQVADYVAEHDVPVNPLVEQGYPSIGCGPCTLRPLLTGDARSGRWAGFAKTECGLHS